MTDPWNHYSNSKHKFFPKKIHRNYSDVGGKQCIRASWQTEELIQHEQTYPKLLAVMQWRPCVCHWTQSLLENNFLPTLKPLFQSNTPSHCIYVFTRYRNLALASGLTTFPPSYPGPGFCGLCFYKDLSSAATAATTDAVTSLASCSPPTSIATTSSHHHYHHHHSTSSNDSMSRDSQLRSETNEEQQKNIWKLLKGIKMYLILWMC